MNVASILFLALPFLADAQELSHLYSVSPLELHSALRSRALQGWPIAPLVRIIDRQTGDSSFSSLSFTDYRVQKGLELQRKGHGYWEEGSLDMAIEAYSQASHLLRAAGAVSETRFCLYYIANLLREQGKLDAAWEIVSRALSLEDRPSPYLEALLHETTGNILWFRGALAEATRAFSTAGDRWLQVGYALGIAIAYGNLALVYEELNLSAQALKAHKTAKDHLIDGIEPDIRAQFNANYCGLLVKLGRLDEARRCLSRALSLSPENGRLKLLTLEVNKDIQKLWQVRFQDPALDIERILLLGRLLIQQEPEPALNLFDRALRLSRSQDLGLYERKSLLLLASGLERTGHLKQAEETYRQGLRKTSQLLQEWVLPYGRTAAPFVEGMVRTQVRLGLSEQARRTILRLTRSRRAKANRMAQIRLSTRRQYNSLSAIASLPELPPVHLSGEEPQPSSWVSRNTNLIELWPDSSAIFVWIDGSAERVFRVLPTGPDLQSSLDIIVDGLYQNSFPLPEPVLARHLQIVHEKLWKPLEPYLNGTRILIVPHGHLQFVPFEALRGEKVLLQKYSFSYLPSRFRPPVLPADFANPFFYMPRGFENRWGAGREKSFFRRQFPEADWISTFPRKASLRPLWMHLSSHFKMDSDLWFLSSFESSGEIVSLSDFLASDLQVRLLSLGVCDGGNGYLSPTPFWMGISELLLGNRSEMLVLSRWKLDEFSVGIYLDFYRLLKDGHSADRALQLARLKFQQQVLSRGGSRVDGSHPYWWAGIVYIGWPGTSVYSPVLPVSKILVGIGLICLFPLFRLGPGDTSERPSS